MFDVSVIRKTGQWWKLVLSTAALLAGGLAMLVARQHMAEASEAIFGLLFGGIILCLGSLVFACAAIRCPKCHAHWFWAAVSKQGSCQWLAWLLSRPTCPNCSFPGDTASQ